MKKLFLAMSCQILSQSISAAPSVTVDYRFTEAQSQQFHQGQATVDIPLAAHQPTFTDINMAKTLRTIELANLISRNIDKYASAQCEVFPPLHCPIPGSPWYDSKGEITYPGPASRICEERMQVAAQLESELRSYRASLSTFSFKNNQLETATRLIDTLVDNMRNHAKIFRPSCKYDDLKSTGFAAEASIAAAPSLHLTAGGAQDYGYFKKIVEDGNVPSKLVIEGFLSEFDLSLGDRPCKDLICVFPEVAINKDRLFVQVGMASNQKPATFVRKPLNVSIVLDISGSMSATNSTHQSRLEWAKDALAASVAQLNENDVLSIVVFDTESEILLRPIKVTDKSAIFRLIEGLQTRGSTNLEAGLRDGYNLVSENLDSTFENRVILISDAGLNTGVTNTAELLRLVTDHAVEDIGLTAIGMGSNFQEDFIHAISRSRGGNYLFVNSGDELAKFFKNFSYLVSPVAYGFKANLSINGIPARLVKSYGIPMSPGAQVQSLFDIQTLFFSEGGGAIVLEYELTGHSIN